MTSGTMKASHIIAVLNICKRGDLVFLRKLLSSNCDLDEVKDRKGRNALHYCAEPDDGPSGQAKPGGRLACAALLLESEFKLQNQPDKDGFLPFHHAVIHGNIPFAKLLLSHGVDVNSLVSPIVTGEDNREEGNTTVSGRSALHLAVIYANLEMLDFLLSGSFEDDKGDTHNFTIDVGIQDAQSATALHYAVQLPEGISASMIKSIVELSDTDINCADGHGRTPLIWAATIGASLAASILLELGAEPCRAEKSGLTALHCAASRGHVFTVQTIIQHIDDTHLTKEDRRGILDAQDGDGCTPLFYSITMGHISVTEKLLAAGADPRATDSRGRSLFHCTSKTPANNVTRMVDLLLDYGADPEKVNVVGDTALHEACSTSNKDCVARLLQIRAVNSNLINLRNASNQTALQIATHQALRTKDRTPTPGSAVEICQLLVEAGAEVGSDEENESSPLSMVRKCLRNTPNYRPALELERVFNGSAKTRCVANMSKEFQLKETSSANEDSHNISEISSLSFDGSVCANEEAGSTASENVDTIPSEDEEANKKSCSMNTTKSHESSSETRHGVDQTNATRSHVELAEAPDELQMQSAGESGSSAVASKSKIATSKNSSFRSKASRTPSSASYSHGSHTSRYKSTTSNKMPMESVEEITSGGYSTPRRVGQSKKGRIHGQKCSKNHSPTDDASSILESTSRRQSPPRRAGTASITSMTESTHHQRASSKSRSSKSQSTHKSENAPAFKKAKSASLSHSTPLPMSTATPSEMTSTTLTPRNSTECSNRTVSQSHGRSDHQPEEMTKASASISASERSGPLRAQHLPAWTQTSFDMTLPNKRSRPNRNCEPKSDLTRHRRRPQSCDFQRNTSEREGRQKLPQPTITPYLMPVARWPRTMASMLLMGEVSPLYCAQTLDAAVKAKAGKRMLKKDAFGNMATERVRSAMEARVQLSLAEKDFVKLAAQVLDQYDTLLIERQKLARTRTTQQVGK